MLPTHSILLVCFSFSKFASRTVHTAVCMYMCMFVCVCGVCVCVVFVCMCVCVCHLCVCLNFRESVGSGMHDPITPCNSAEMLVCAYRESS